MDTSIPTAPASGIILERPSRIGAASPVTSAGQSKLPWGYSGRASRKVASLSRHSSVAKSCWFASHRISSMPTREIRGLTTTCHTLLAAMLGTTGKRSGETFDDMFDWLEARETVRELVLGYIRSIEDDVDREIALRLHDERVGESATNKDILRVLSRTRLSEVESLYGERCRLAADRGRRQRNYSALRCFVREIRRARRDRRLAATAAW